MSGIGHFDFGANLRPIDFDAWLSTARHTDPRTIGFWLEYWLAAYGHVLGHHAGLVRVLPYETFCANPDVGVRWLADALDLGINDRQRLSARRDTIRVPPLHDVDVRDVAASLLAETQDMYRHAVRHSDLGSTSNGS